MSIVQIQRKKTREVYVGGVALGGNHPIIIQSMCNTDTRDIDATIKQILELEDAGCEMVRVAIPDMEAAEAISSIKKAIHIPLVADIHFDYRLALKVMEQGIDKVRINPGNIGSEQRIQQVVAMAKEKNIPIRIGVNSGSLEKEYLEQYGGVTPKGLVESALKHVRILERYSFEDIVVSIKASSVPFSLEAYKLLSDAIPYPLHVGITEAGTVYAGTVKSAVGIGAILSQGIGDTIRVSLTGNPVEEVKAAKEILKSLELRSFGVEMVSCPTCGRTQVDLIRIANEVEKRCQAINKHIKVAVMGCVVNGPGEAREADIGIAGGKGEGLIFKKGEIIRKVPEHLLVEELMREIELL
jgi:(E)-4-hydroxy-3-methylbut-2-enyl-diphosphate synthase